MAEEINFSSGRSGHLHELHHRAAHRVRGCGADLCRPPGTGRPGRGEPAHEVNEELSNLLANLMK